MKLSDGITQAELAGWDQTVLRSIRHLAAQQEGSVCWLWSDSARDTIETRHARTVIVALRDNADSVHINPQDLPRCYELIVAYGNVTFRRAVDLTIGDCRLGLTVIGTGRRHQAIYEPIVSVNGGTLRKLAVVGARVNLMDQITLNDPMNPSWIGPESSIYTKPGSGALSTGSESAVYFERGTVLNSDQGPTPLPIAIIGTVTREQGPVNIKGWATGALIRTRPTVGDDGAVIHINPSASGRLRLIAQQHPEQSLCELQPNDWPVYDHRSSERTPLTIATVGGQTGVDAEGADMYAFTDDAPAYPVVFGTTASQFNALPAFTKVVLPPSDNRPSPALWLGLDAHVDAEGEGIIANVHGTLRGVGDGLTVMGALAGFEPFSSVGSDSSIRGVITGKVEFHDPDVEPVLGRFMDLAYDRPWMDGIAMFGGPVGFAALLVAFASSYAVGLDKTLASNLTNGEKASVAIGTFMLGVALMSSLVLLCTPSGRRETKATARAFCRLVASPASKMKARLCRR